MIYFLAKREHLFTIRNYLRLVRGPLAGRVVPVAYETLLTRMTRDYWWQSVRGPWRQFRRKPWRSFTPDGVRLGVTFAHRLYRAMSAGRVRAAGTYIFADLERLSAEEVERAALLWKTLAESGIGVRLLNHPVRSMRRYELLRHLYERGENRFNVYRLTEARSPQRYPVFLRGENDHHGPRSPLLGTPEELGEALATLDREGYMREGLLVTEFCNTADTWGIYRTYGAFIVGERIIPKSLTFSRSWAQKGPDLLEARMLAEEHDYVEKNPHEGRLREVFRLARIDYGRMDYGMLDGQVQVWEINTNPTIRSGKLNPRSARRSLLESFVDTMADAFTGVEAR